MHSILFLVAIFFLLDIFSSGALSRAMLPFVSAPTPTTPFPTSLTPPSGSCPAAIPFGAGARLVRSTTAVHPARRRKTAMSARSLPRLTLSADHKSSLSIAAAMKVLACLARTSTPCPADANTSAGLGSTPNSAAAAAKNSRSIAGLNFLSAGDHNDPRATPTMGFATNSVTHSSNYSPAAKAKSLGWTSARIHTRSASSRSLPAMAKGKGVMKKYDEEKDKTEDGKDENLIKTPEEDRSEDDNGGTLAIMENADSVQASLKSANPTVVMATTTINPNYRAWHGNPEVVARHREAEHAATECMYAALEDRPYYLKDLLKNIGNRREFWANSHLQGASEVKVVRKLGAGGFGAAFEVEREERNGKRLHVLKVSANYGEYRDAWAAELCALGELEELSSVAQLVEASIGPEFLFLLLEAGDGSLNNHLFRDDELPLGHVLCLATSAAYGLEEIHDRGVIHLDVKPANMAFTPAEEGDALKEEILGNRMALWIDWGGADILENGYVAPRLAGTPGFMPPEQLAGHALTTAADIWSFGVTLFEMIENRSIEEVIFTAMPEEVCRLFAADARLFAEAAAEGAYEWWYTNPHWLTAAGQSVRRIVEACLQIEPSRRPSADNVGLDLQDALVAFAKTHGLDLEEDDEEDEELNEEPAALPPVAPTVLVEPAADSSPPRPSPLQAVPESGSFLVPSPATGFASLSASNSSDSRSTPYRASSTPPTSLEQGMLSTPDTPTTKHSADYRPGSVSSPNCLDESSAAQALGISTGPATIVKGEALTSGVQENAIPAVTPHISWSSLFPPGHVSATLLKKAAEGPIRNLPSDPISHTDDGDVVNLVAQLDLSSWSYHFSTMETTTAPETDTGAPTWETTGNDDGGTIRPSSIYSCELAAAAPESQTTIIQPPLPATTTPRVSRWCRVKSKLTRAIKKLASRTSNK